MSDTVSIVLISHSRQVAEGAADLAAQICGGRVAIAGVGGLDDGSLGTSIDTLADAVEKVRSPRGTVILADLGSAVLTVRTLLDDLDDDSIRLVDAPFVEGAVAVAVTASTGADLAAVAKSGEDAWAFRKT